MLDRKKHAFIAHEHTHCMQPRHALLSKSDYTEQARLSSLSLRLCPRLRYTHLATIHAIERGHPPNDVPTPPSFLIPPHQLRRRCRPTSAATDQA
eukprot:218839-Chlamydomonas_euryale.AAC.17